MIQLARTSIEDAVIMRWQVSGVASWQEQTQRGIRKGGRTLCILRRKPLAATALHIPCNGDQLAVVPRRG